jgi:hypothetical protein
MTYFPKAYILTLFIPRAYIHTIIARRYVLSGFYSREICLSKMVCLYGQYTLPRVKGSKVLNGMGLAEKGYKCAKNASYWTRISCPGQALPSLLRRR